MECFILAGGQSRRFGEDKLSYSLGGRRVIERVFETALEVFDRVLVITKNPKRLTFLKGPLITDLLPLQAPIVGLYTATVKAKGEIFALLSGDIPLIKREVLQILRDRGEPPVTVFKAGDRVHPLIGVYSKSLRETIKKRIERNDLSMMGVLEEVGYNLLGEDLVRGVDPNLDSFVNLNTKEDLLIISERAR